MKKVKAKIIERIMYCTIECPFCEEEMVYDSTESYITAEGTDVLCPYCERYCSVDTSDYLSQYN